MAQVKTAVKNQRRVLSKFTKKRYWSPRYNAADKLRDTLLYHGAIPHNHISIINATALTPLGNFAHHLRIFFHEGFGNND